MTTRRTIKARPSATALLAVAFAASIAACGRKMGSDDEKASSTPRAEVAVNSAQTAVNPSPATPLESGATSASGLSPASASAADSPISSSPAGVEQGGETSATKKGYVAFNFTADYDNPPVRIIILRNDWHLTGGWYNRWVDGITYFGALLLLSGVDFKLQVVDASIFPRQAPVDQEPYPVPGLGRSVEPSGQVILDPSTESFATVFNGNVTAPYRNYYQRPLTAIKEAFDLASVATSGSFGFWDDPDAKLVVIYAGFEDVLDYNHMPERMADHELVAYLKGKGVKSFVANAIDVPPTGCADEVYKDAAMKPYEWTPIEFGWRLPMHHLAKMTGGFTERICTRTFAPFFDKIVSEQLMAPSFRVKLPFLVSEADAKAMTIAYRGESSEVPLERWTLSNDSEGHSFVDIPTLLPKGAELVAYIPKTVTYAVVHSQKPPDDDIGGGADAALPARQQKFFDKMNPALRAACANCHGPNSNRAYRVDSYDSANTFKAEILARMQLPDTNDANGNMPPGADNSLLTDLQAQDQTLLQELTTWLTTEN